MTRTRDVAVAAVLAVAGLTACGSGAGGPSGAPTSAAATGTVKTSVAVAPAAGAGTGQATGTGVGPGRLTNVTLTVPSGERTGAFATTRVLQAPKGAKLSLFALVPGARLETWTPQGDLLVSVPDSGSILRLHPNAKGTGVTTSTLVSGLQSPQGMAFDTVGRKQFLYVVGTGSLWRYSWYGRSAGNRTTLLSNLPGGGSGGYAHPAKNVVIGRNHAVYIDIGSATNADPANRDAGQAEVVKVGTGGHYSVVERGVRNGDGLAVDPRGQLWTAINMRDMVANPQGQVEQSYVNDHPPDEIVRVQQGRDVGWPYCDPDQTLTRSADRYGTIPLRNDPQVDANGSVNCAKLPPVERGLPAHSAPLGFRFLVGSKAPASLVTGAVVGTHGSNNHVPPRPAEVYWMRWTGTTLGPAQPLLAGFVDGSGNRWGKSVDVVPGPDGSLYVSDDTAGAIYRLTLAR